MFLDTTGLRHTEARDNCNIWAGALIGDAAVYDPDQSFGVPVFISATVEELNIHKGIYSGECMTMQTRAQKTTLIGATFESCDHGIYFVGETALARSCTFRHYKWSSLLCASLEYPFKEGEIKNKVRIYRRKS